MHKNALFKGRSTLVAMVTTTACSRPGASFSYKNVAKKEWNVYFSIRYCTIWRCLHLMFSTTNVSDKWNMHGFGRMLSYEQYPEEKSRLWSSSFFGATDGNFIEKYSVTPSWQRTCLWQMTGVRIVSCRSADFNMFPMTYKYNRVSSEDFGSLKFLWKKVQHSASGWYSHDLRYMFVVTSSCPPWRLINFFKRWQPEARFLFGILLIR